mmetsp:Transcript_23397/g.66707  ORF Transcript_23397/g.66707 Transcript_23397/m.66707 type:complete len:319 (-) Transcript_23397:734-1690(-)
MAQPLRTCSSYEGRSPIHVHVMPLSPFTRSASCPKGYLKWSEWCTHRICRLFRILVRSCTAPTLLASAWSMGMMSRFRSFEVHLGCGHWMSGTGPSPGMPFFILDTWSPTQLWKQVSQKRWEQLVITGLIITKVHSGQTNWLLDPSASICFGRMRRRPCLSSTSEGRRPADCPACGRACCSSGAFRCRVSAFCSCCRAEPPGVAPAAEAPADAALAAPEEAPGASWFSTLGCAGGDCAAPVPELAADCATKRRAALAPLTSQAEVPLGVAIPLFGVFTTEREGGFMGPGMRFAGTPCFGCPACDWLYAGDEASSRTTL